MKYPDTPEHWITLSADFIHAMVTMGQKPKAEPVAPKQTKKPAKAKK